jgi:hypothetical protein
LSGTEKPIGPHKKKEKKRGKSIGGRGESGRKENNLFWRR